VRRRGARHRSSGAYLLIDTPQGDELRLWDTPGFGDSARLLKRLKQSGHPLGWFLRRVWDRYVDRPFFSSQQAVRNVRDEADVVLYLVNASEDPAAAGYVDAEIADPRWISKPVIVLLNQLGPAAAGRAEAADVQRLSASVPGIRGCATRSRSTPSPAAGCRSTCSWTGSVQCAGRAQRRLLAARRRLALAQSRDVRAVDAGARPPARSDRH